METEGVSVYDAFLADVEELDEKCHDEVAWLIAFAILFFIGTTVTAVFGLMLAAIVLGVLTVLVVAGINAMRLDRPVLLKRLLDKHLPQLLPDVPSDQLSVDRYFIATWRRHNYRLRMDLKTLAGNQGEAKWSLMVIAIGDPQDLVDWADSAPHT